MIRLKNIDITGFNYLDKILTTKNGDVDTPLAIVEEIYDGYNYPIKEVYKITSKERKKS